MSTIENTHRITLTDQEFINAWKGGYKGVKKEDGRGYWEDAWGNVVFENVVSSYIQISEPIKLPYLSIYNSSLKLISIAHSEIGGFTFENTVVGIFHLYSVTTNRIELRKKTILNQLFIDNNSSIKEKFTIIDKTKIFKIHLEAKELRKIGITNSYIQNFIWKQDSFCNLTIDNCELEMLSFNQAIIPKDSVFQISDCSINRLRLHQFVNTGWLNISSLEPLTSYERFVEKNNEPILIDKTYQFEYVENNDSILCFSNSDLGRTTFIDCLLNNFDRFVFNNTKMLEVFSAGTELPKEVTLPTSSKGLDKAEQQRLAFGQFKKISENRGDNVQATEFLALEMDAYAKQIEKAKGKRGVLFNLRLNKFSSNWGNDWVRAVVVTFGINSFCFLLYCLSLGYSLGYDCDLFWKLASYSLEFLNPLRKADFLKTEQLVKEITPLARTIDYFSRVVIAYFVYQTIQAFRRFGKKS